MKQIILFGTGEIAHDFLHFLGREKIAYFVDNNMEKVGSNIEGIEIISFKKLIEIHQNYELIIAVGAEYTPEIAKQLSKNSIVFSSRYDFPYYMIAGEKHYVSVEKIIENRIKNKLISIILFLLHSFSISEN